jgi:hypothetical protein
MLAPPTGTVTSRVSGLKGCPMWRLRMSRLVEMTVGCGVRSRLEPIERLCNASTVSI